MTINPLLSSSMHQQSSNQQVQGPSLINFGNVYNNNVLKTLNGIPIKSSSPLTPAAASVAAYQTFRSKPSLPCPRNHSYSPMNNVNKNMTYLNKNSNFQNIAQMNLSTNSKKFPIRIIFPTNNSNSSSSHRPSVPSSTSISKAGALYIMNVMNNQRCYTWNNLKQQKEFGRKVAQKILSSPENSINCNNTFGIDKSNGREKNCCMLASDAPILGSLLHEFLLSYGMYACADLIKC